MSLLVQPGEGGAPWATLSRPLFPAVTTLFVSAALTVPLSHMGAPREPHWRPAAGALGEDGSPPAGVMTGLPDGQQEGEAGCLTVCSHTVKLQGGGLGQLGHESGDQNANCHHQTHGQGSQAEQMTQLGLR